MRERPCPVDGCPNWTHAIACPRHYAKLPDTILAPLSRTSKANGLDSKAYRAAYETAVRYLNRRKRSSQAANKFQISTELVAVKYRKPPREGFSMSKTEAIDMSERELQEGDLVLIPARVVGVTGERHWFNLKLVTTSTAFRETSLCLNSKQVFLDMRPPEVGI